MAVLLDEIGADALNAARAQSQDRKNLQRPLREKAGAYLAARPQSEPFVIAAAEIWNPWNKKEALKLAVEEARTRLRAEAPPKDLPPSCVPQVKATLPSSWTIQLRFTLDRPLITKDEPRLYYTENAIRRERATGIPYLPGTSWRGAFRSALLEMRRENLEVSEEDLHALLGSFYEAANDVTQMRRGRLQFYSTYFSKTGRYMTHALSRRSKTGEAPVEYETVPEGTEGVFTLLYWIPGQAEAHGEELASEAQRHLWLTCRAVAVMLLDTGVGGKKSTGFGSARNELATCKFSGVGVRLPETNIDSLSALWEWGNDAPA
jgi:CRISPR/Cas system CSM-associated protein Csm3 (group 7 of RAMP superfamily)